MNPLFSDSAAFALQRLTDLGWSPAAAQGMVGNLIQESGPNLNPTLSHDGGTGFGIAGFRDPQPGRGRWTNLRNFARERGLDHRTLDAQLQFIDHELRTSERGVGNRLRQARDPAEAARVAIDFFRPEGWTSRNPTGGHGWDNRLRNTMTLAGAPMPTNRIALNEVQRASADPPLPPPRPGGLGGLGGTEPPAAYASMPDTPAEGARSAQGGDPNQTVPSAMMALNAGEDDRAPRAEAFGQTVPSLQQAGIQQRHPIADRASGLDSFGPGGPQSFGPPVGEPFSMFLQGPRQGGVANMERHPLRPPQPNMTPRPDTPPSFITGPDAQSRSQGEPSFGPIRVASRDPSMVPDALPARPSTPNVDAVAGMPTPQQQPPMPPPRPDNIGGQTMPRGIDPNQYAGDQWIPPDVGRQLAAQQMSGQTGMPAQGAQAAQGGGGAPQAPQGAPGGLGGLGGLRGPLHAAFLSMLTSPDRRQPFANMPAFMQQQMEIEQQMQAQRQAEAQQAESQRFRESIIGGGGSDAVVPGGADGAPQELTINRTLDALYARRSRIAQAAVMAPSSEDRAAANVMLGDIDKQIARFEKQRDTALDQRVQMLEETGLPRNVAQGIAAGRLRADRDPVSGALQVVDMGTGQIVYPGAGESALQGTGGPGVSGDASTLPEDTDFLRATGVGGFSATLANTVADVFGGNLPNEEAERASQALDNLRVRTQIALASEVTGRPSNYLLEQFDGLAVRPAEISMGPGRAQERFRQTQAMLANEIQLTRQIVDNPRQFQPSKVSNARIRLNELETLFNDYSRVIESFDRRAPGGGEGGMGSVPPAAVEELMRDPSEAAQREFDEVFGQGAAQRALGGQ